MKSAYERSDSILGHLLKASAPPAGGPQQRLHGHPGLHHESEIASYCGAELPHRAPSGHAAPLAFLPIPSIGPRMTTRRGGLSAAWPPVAFAAAATTFWQAASISASVSVRADVLGPGRPSLPRVRQGGGAAAEGLSSGHGYTPDPPVR
jgi:hypothetical protein